MAGNGYNPLYPHTTLPEESIRKFVSSFFEISDSPDHNESWVNCFTKDAEVIMGTDRGNGENGKCTAQHEWLLISYKICQLTEKSAELRELRRRMWSVVTSRKHTLTKVFPGRFGGLEEYELMLFGEVARKKKDGLSAVFSWAGHAILRRESECWKFSYYRVWQ